MIFSAEFGLPRPDGFTTVILRRGDRVGNDVLVPEARKALAALNLQGGPGLLFTGPISLPVAMALAHDVAHLYQFIACFDPKLERFVVTISHSAAHCPGDLIR